MFVKKTIELPDGSVNFEGEFSQPEVDFLLTLALQNLLLRGLVPFAARDETDVASIAPPSRELN